MRCACVDIGSNTTRVLVADVSGGQLREVLAAKSFTRLGSELRRTGALPPDAAAAVAAVVAEQVATARNAGAQRVRVVATAAIRDAADGDDLCAAVRARTGHAVEVLPPHEEARLAFAGATRTFAAPLRARVAIVDVGGGSSEIAVGTRATGVEWSTSLNVGSGSLAEECLHSDPPAPAELELLCRRAGEELAGVSAPPAERAIAVGGSATSTARLAGMVIDPARVEVVLAELGSAPAAAIAARYALDPERVRLLPAGLALLGAASRQLGLALEVGRGGLREGACLELAAASRM